MMMTYKPLYRGTHNKITADGPAARKWFINQIAAEMPGDDMGDVKVTWGAERPAGFGHIHVNNDYFHVFRMKTPGSNWKDTRFVIRKDGTINLTAAVDCAIASIASKARVDRKAEIRKQNAVIWDEYCGDATIKDVAAKFKMRLELSSSVVGDLEVQLSEYDWGFTITQQIQIRSLTAFHNWASEVQRQIKEGW